MIGRKEFFDAFKKWAIDHPSICRTLMCRRGRICKKGVNNTIVNNAYSMKHSLILITGQNNSIYIGRGVKLNNVVICVTGRNHHLTIEDNVKFIHGGRIRLEDEGNMIKIGRKTVIYNAFLSCSDKATNIMIGEDCLFSVDVILRTSDSHSILDMKSNERINPGESITVGNHVWLCNGVNILKGVKIGDGCVIGTQSVVTKDIPNRSVACGNPARVVKSEITWNEKRFF